MRFENPYFLLLLLALAPLTYLAWRRKAPSIILPSIRPALAANSGKKRSLKDKIPLIFEVFAVALLILALARPQKGIEELKRRLEGIDIMLVIDFSGSMRIIDVPSNYRDAKSIRNAIQRGQLRQRSEIAKEELIRFVGKRSNDRIGLIAFGTHSYLAAPPTLDRQWIFRQIERLNPGDLGGATNIAASLASAVSRLKDSEAKREVIILFTDGKNTVDTIISPLQAAKIAKDYGITVHTVGIGSENAVMLVDSVFGKQLQQAPHEFDEQLLREIATTTGGIYFAAKDADGLKRTLGEIDKLEKSSFEAPKFMDYRELAFPLITTALICLLLSALLSKTLLFKAP